MKQTNDKVFIDTNLLVYFVDKTDEKQKQVSDKLNQYENCFISVQVLNEFINTCFKKKLLTKPEIELAIKDFVETFDVALIDVETITEALNLKEKYGFSYYDSLIISSALQIGCNILFTEDMQNGQIIENQLTIINPFK